MMVSVGWCYLGFGGKNFISCGAMVDQNAINNEINKYRSELAQAQADLATLKMPWLTLSL